MVETLPMDIFLRANKRFCAHAVCHCFLRNLHPALRKAHTVIYLATVITADLLTESWHPARPP